MAFRTVSGPCGSYGISNTPQPVFQTVTAQVYIRIRDGEKRKTRTRQDDRRDTRFMGGPLSISSHAGCRNLPVKWTPSKTREDFARYLEEERDGNACELSFSASRQGVALAAHATCWSSLQIGGCLEVYARVNLSLPMGLFPAIHRFVRTDRKRKNDPKGARSSWGPEGNRIRPGAVVKRKDVLG